MTDHDKATPHEELPTPRTDAASRRYDIDGLTTAGQVELCHANFARLLERENAGLQAKLEQERKVRLEFEQNTQGVLLAWKRDYEAQKDRGDEWRADCLTAEQALARCFEETREACAKLAESYLKGPCPSDTMALYLPKAIRALTQEPAETTQNKDHG